MDPQRRGVVQVEAFLQGLEKLRSSDGIVNGIVEVNNNGGDFTNGMAQQLGMVLLETTQNIKVLRLPIESLTCTTGTSFPALLEYLETTRTLREVQLMGRFLGDETVVTTHDTLDVLIGSIKKQQVTKDIFVTNMQLSKATIHSLQSFHCVTFFLCTIKEPIETDTIPMKSTLPTKTSFLTFGHKESPEFLRAVADIFTSPRNVIFVVFDPKSKDHEQKVAAALYLVKKHKHLEYIRFDNIDMDGSRVPGVLEELSSVASSGELGLALQWRKEYAPDLALFQKHDKAVLHALSNTLLVDFKYLINQGKQSILTPKNRRAADLIITRNLRLPFILKTPEEYWMTHLAVLERLLHPEFLCHPRYRLYYARFLQNNFMVHMWLQDCHKQAQKRGKGRAVIRRSMWMDSPEFWRWLRPKTISTFLFEESRNMRLPKIQYEDKDYHILLPCPFLVWGIWWISSRGAMRLSSRMTAVVRSLLGSSKTNDIRGDQST